MHNALARLQATFGFFTSCAFTLAGIIALLSVLPYPAPTRSPSAAITARNVQVVKGRPHYYSAKREEYAQIRFDLQADLSSLFTWNTKQLFVYVTVNYPSEGGQSSESVIWDMIIPATSTPYSFQNLKTQYWDTKKKKAAKPKTKALSKPGVITLKNQKPKYQITDPSGSLSNKKNATLQVNWNVQPWVGVLVWDQGFFGSRVGTWKKGKDGKSKSFDFPPLKSASTSIQDEKPKMPDAGSAVPVVEV